MMNLPRDEMAFRKTYESLVIEQELTTIFRPGNRLFPNFRGYKNQEIVMVRIIEQLGCDERKIAPIFSDIKIPVRINDIRTFDISDLSSKDFHGSSPDVQDLEQLLQHLEEIYDRPIASYDNTVTRIQIQYLSEYARTKRAESGAI
ncbi:MAG: hypothetical protein ACI9FB_001940 [Candidatus Azotimanducaceae bacterium]|jgi:hypothetical protein